MKRREYDVSVTINRKRIRKAIIDPPFSYFTTDKMELKGKFYKLVWLLEEERIYIGIINAYRR